MRISVEQTTILNSFNHNDWTDGPDIVYKLVLGTVLQKNLNNISRVLQTEWTIDHITYPEFQTIAPSKIENNAYGSVLSYYHISIEFLTRAYKNFLCN